MTPGLYERAESAAAYVRGRIGEVPRVAVVLGSGLAPLADRLRERVVIPYATIPSFPSPSVSGHPGNLIAGRVGGAPVLYLQGRSHYYEGNDLEAVTFPVRALRALGVSTLILTAAAGGVRPDWGPGTLVGLSDHLNLLGQNPLRGPNDPRLGPRFPDMTEVYALRLRTQAAAEAERLGLTLKEGVYACMPGPSYETPAEVRMLRALGADVVGMSTVPEAIVARQCGLAVLALALVTNAAAGLSAGPISHAEVLAEGAAAVPRLGALVEALVQTLAEGPR